MTGILGSSILITGIVICMMLMIELINERTGGRFFRKFSSSGVKQVIFAGLLGCIPGCIGGFAAVSLYSRKMLSMGALTAMMIASSGDEAFVMLAMFPGKAMLLTAVLFAIAVVSGTVIDRIWPHGIRDTEYIDCKDEHEEGKGAREDGKGYRLKRAGLAAGFLLFIAVLSGGFLGHSHTEGSNGVQINLLNETWMNVLFGIFALSLVFYSLFGSRKAIDIEMHIIRKHALPIFLWTLGALAFVHILIEYVDMGRWISENAPLMIVLGSLIGIIPESGPNLIFVTLFANGSIPFSVLLANSISQDGHSSIPLLAGNKRSFVVTKLLNTLIALVCGFAAFGIENLFS